MSIYKFLKSVGGKVGIEEMKQYLKVSASGFDKNIQKVKLIKASDGKCVAELKIEKEHTNSRDELHTGLLATLIDAITGFALITHDKNCQLPSLLSVTTDLRMSYIKAAALGDEIVVKANTVKAGEIVAHLECEITNKATGDLLAKGGHIKCFMSQKE